MMVAFGDENGLRREGREEVGFGKIENGLGRERKEEDLEGLIPQGRM